VSEGKKPFCLRLDVLSLRFSFALMKDQLRSSETSICTSSELEGSPILLYIYIYIYTCVYMSTFIRKVDACSSAVGSYCSYDSYGSYGSYGSYV
jgi:hypothetical protein